MSLIIKSLKTQINIRNKRIMGKSWWNSTAAQMNDGNAVIVYYCLFMHYYETLPKSQTAELLNIVNCHTSVLRYTWLPWVNKNIRNAAFAWHILTEHIHHRDVCSVCVFSSGRSHFFKKNWILLTSQMFPKKVICRMISHSWCRMYVNLLWNVLQLFLLS